MNDADRFKLLYGPYRSPPLRRGDRTTCLFRDGEVIVTGWSDARIAWPRCRLICAQGGSGLLVDEESCRRSSSRLRADRWLHAPGRL